MTCVIYVILRLRAEYFKEREDLRTDYAYCFWDREYRLRYAAI